MTATVTIVTQEDDNAVLVTNAAIAYAGTGNNAVMVMRNGAPTRVPIQTGNTDGTNTVVLSGLQPGDTVVTSASTGTSSRQTTQSSGNVFGVGAPGVKPQIQTNQGGAGR
jgi:multidrug efflux pump subunit AcrA (membrane-fusion protein)